MSSKTQQETQFQKFTNNLLIGGTSASISKTMVAPLERIKLILQNQWANPQILPEDRYKGIVDCFLRVTKEEGYLSLWRGNLVNVGRYFPTQALNFAFKDTLKYYLNPYDKVTHPFHFFLGNVASGGAAGAASLCFVYPLDFIRTRLSVDMGKDEAQRQFKGFRDCAAQILKSDGLLGFYRGFVPSIMGIIVYRAAYFGMYDTGRAILFPEKSAKNFFKSWAFALCTSTMASTIGYPLDTIRRRLMMQSGKNTIEYKGIVDCSRHILRNEGLHGFFKGVFANVIRGVGSALVLVLYDQMKTLV